MCSCYSYTGCLLPIKCLIKFKITCITYKTISTNQPAYIHSLLKHYVPAWTMHSLDSNLLSVPCVHTCFGSHSSAVAAPTIWNIVPLNIHKCASISCFVTNSKLFFQNLAYRWSYCLIPALHPRFGSFLVDTVHYKHVLIHLLTCYRQYKLHHRINSELI